MKTEETERRQEAPETQDRVKDFFRWVRSNRLLSSIIIIGVVVIGIGSFTDALRKISTFIGSQRQTTKNRVDDVNKGGVQVNKEKSQDMDHAPGDSTKPYQVRTGEVLSGTVADGKSRFEAERRVLKNPYGIQLARGEHFTQITVHWSTAIDGLSFETSTGRSYSFGETQKVGLREGETHHDTIALTKERFLKQVIVRLTPLRANISHITAMTFVLSDGSQIQCGMETPRSTPRTLSAAPDWEICGFHGGYSTSLLSMGIYTRQR